MATSSCPKCSGSSFEMKENGNVRNASFKIMFIQCSSCGTVVGTTDYYNVPSLLEKIARKLGFNLHG
jgi:uncharacterized Zn finger protein